MARGAQVDEHPLLKPHGLKTVNISGDGNCLFRSLSDQYFGSQGRYPEIRASIIQHMRDFPDEYKPFVNVEVGGGSRRNPKRKNAGAYATPFNASGPNQQEIDDNYENYIQKMSRDGVYGDNLEIRAFSKVYDMDLRIWNRENNYYVRAASDGVVRSVAHIAYHGWEHYSSVRNIAGPLTGLPEIKMEGVSAAEIAEVAAAAKKDPFIDDWMIKAVTTSLPHLVSEQVIMKALKDNNGSIDMAVTALLEEPPSAPGTPGSFSNDGSSSIERDLDSDDEDEIWGPNKRQNRKIRAARALNKEHTLKKPNLVALEAIPSVELSQSGTDMTTKVAEDAGTIPTVRIFDNDFNVPSEDGGSEYSESSRAPSVAPSAATRPKIVLHINSGKSQQKQHGPRAKRITAREKKEMKKAAQKQASKERKKQGVKSNQFATSISTIKRDSPPMEQVIGMKTLYI